jgi:hypothetical protein
MLGNKIMLKRRWEDNQLREAVKVSTSWSAVMRCLGLAVAGNSVKFVKSKAHELGLNVSHFKGHGWSKGMMNMPSPPQTISLKEILVEQSSYTSSKDLKRRLFKAGLKEKRCEHCSNTEWMEKPIPLQLDHINGIRNDNRIENLQVLCPNCHALTPTWGGRNYKARSSRG